MNKFQKILRPETEKDKQQQQVLILLLIAGIGYYFFIYLDRKRIEAKSEIRKLFQTNPSITTAELDASLWKYKENWEEYVDSLYLGSGINSFTCKIKEAIKEKVEERKKPTGELREKKKEAIEEMKKNLKRGEGELPETFIKNFISKISNAQLSQISSIKNEALETIKEEWNKKKGLQWKRKNYNWADRWILRRKHIFDKAWDKEIHELGKEPIRCPYATPYVILFPPTPWEKLTEEQKSWAKEHGHNELNLDSETKSFRFNDMITEWYDKVVLDTVRGELDPRSKKDNNAFFYDSGVGGTGKTSITRKLAYEADSYPLISIKGSTLTPQKQDYDADITALEKFIYTISDISWNLVDNFGFKRGEDGEVRYILFIDEADAVCKHSALDTYTKLTFLKDIMGDVKKEEESKNLWIFATNHKERVAEQVYRPGRLSNPLCFSWTLEDFKYYCNKEGIDNHFPEHWQETDTLNEEDSKWVNRFNKDYFTDSFLPFWKKFISNKESLKNLPKIKKEDATEEQAAQPGIDLGEFFEFFWKLYDSKQLGSFDGRFETPREKKIEKIVSQINQTLDTRLNEIWEKLERMKKEMKTSRQDIVSSIEDSISSVTNILEEIGKRI